MSDEKEYLGEIGGVPVIKDPKATGTYLRSHLASDPQAETAAIELSELLTNRYGISRLVVDEILAFVNQSQQQLLEGLMEQKELYVVDAKDDYEVSAIPVSVIMAKLTELRGKV